MERSQRTPYLLRYGNLKAKGYLCSKDGDGWAHKWGGRMEWAHKWGGFRGWKDGDGDGDGWAYKWEGGSEDGDGWAHKWGGSEDGWAHKWGGEDGWAQMGGGFRGWRWRSKDGDGDGDGWAHKWGEMLTGGAQTGRYVTLQKVTSGHFHPFAVSLSLSNQKTCYTHHQKMKH
ncbi:hypothetical protein DPMN_163459 [Dreissena polymorpha]|uniref:Uncharacterized protein n=1 Tax=Dreissena polymorpha TaxID=45954 RepID=A0A9D4ETB4_DREPO|nr:hypothetical protein DPMN_163459 [Dreissena polymorpha]